MFLEQDQRNLHEQMNYMNKYLLRWHFKDSKVPNVRNTQSISPYTNLLPRFLNGKIA